MCRTFVVGERKRRGKKEREEKEYGTALEEMPESQPLDGNMHCRPSAVDGCCIIPDRTNCLGLHRETSLKSS